MIMKVENNIINSRIVKTFKEEIDQIYEDFIGEYNSQAVRQLIAIKVKDVIDRAKAQYAAEDRKFTIGNTMIAAKHIGEIPISINVYGNDLTSVCIDTDFNGNLILNEINKDFNKSLTN